jgi:hypothetical protein
MNKFRKRLFGILMVLAAVIGLGIVSAQTASAATYHYQWSWSCKSPSGTYAGTLTQRWSIVYSLTNPTKYTLEKVVWSTNPDFTANRVEALFTGTTNGPQVMFAFGGSASSLNDVSAEKVLDPGPNVFGGGSNTWYGATRSAPNYVAEQKLGVWGIGAGNSLATCTDSSASGPTNW